MRERFRRVVAEHPRGPLALKCATAAALAWLIVQPLSGIADQYPYYAPLGAVVVMSRTVVSSMRASLQAAAAILVGAGLGVAVRHLVASEVAAIAVVVALGTLVAGARRLGEMASWVPISALFVLIIGQNDADGYAFAYVGLTALGAAVGVAVNAAVPSLPLTMLGRSESRLLRTLAGQLDDLADGLLQDPLLTQGQWAERGRSVEPQTERVRMLVAEATEARRANWRARRWQQMADRQYEQARALEQLAFLTIDIADLVTEGERADRDNVALGPELRPAAARALRCMAVALRTVHGATADVDALEDAHQSLRELARAIRDLRARTEEDKFAAGTIVVAIQRAIAALSPSEAGTAAVAGPG